MELPRLWAEVDLDAVASNLKSCRREFSERSPLGPTRILGVVKADAYGHGAEPIASTLEKNGVHMLGVGDSHEAIQLREWGIEAPILILGAVVESELADLIQHRVTPTIHSPERIQSLDRAARNLGVKLGVHLLVDTGLSLLGVTPANTLEHIEQILACPNLELEGIGTHLAAPVADPEFTSLQLERFYRLVDRARGVGRRLPLLHVASSASAALRPEARFDMVRLGGLLYGIPPFGPSPTGISGNPPVGTALLQEIQPVLSLYTQVVHMRDLPDGTPVGYDGTFVTDRPTRVATLAVGYHDGYLHRLANRAQVLIRGERAPVIGRVTMDYTLVDVSEIPGTQVGDRATLLGSDQGDRITAAELASWAETIGYEIPCHLGPRVQRIYWGSEPDLEPARRELESEEEAMPSGKRTPRYISRRVSVFGTGTRLPRR